MGTITYVIDDDVAGVVVEVPLSEMTNPNICGLDVIKDGDVIKVNQIPDAEMSKWERWIESYCCHWTAMRVVGGRRESI